MKSRHLNFLEPSGPLQACNGTDLPFFLIKIIKILLNEDSNVMFLYIGVIKRSSLSAHAVRRGVCKYLYTAIINVITILVKAGIPVC